jgi:site-specific DNA-cytosine methylase
VDSSRIDEWRYAKGSKNEFRLRKKDRENVDPELVELYDECMSAPFEKRADKWKEHRHRFLKEVGEDKFYQYDEGAMRFDSPDRPSRTVVTDEIGRTPSRMRHIIEYEEGRYRRLSPEEAERLNGFPAGWTAIEGIKPSRRGFLMGNALVVGIIERLRGPLGDLINRRSTH